MSLEETWRPAPCFLHEPWARGLQGQPAQTPEDPGIPAARVGAACVLPAGPPCATPNGLAERPTSVIISTPLHAGTRGVARRRGGRPAERGPRSAADEDEGHLLGGWWPPPSSLTSHAPLALPERRAGAGGIRLLPAWPAPLPCPWSSVQAQLRMAFQRSLLKMCPLLINHAVTRLRAWKGRLAQKLCLGSKHFGNEDGVRKYSLPMNGIQPPCRSGFARNVGG